MSIRIKLAAGALALSGLISVAPAAAQDHNSSRDVISGETLAVSGFTTAFEGLYLLRPSIRQGRAAPAIDGTGKPDPVVYLDGVRVESWTLQSVQREELETMRYVDPTTANLRYGLGHQGGAIVVTTRRGS